MTVQLLFAVRKVLVFLNEAMAVMFLSVKNKTRIKLLKNIALKIFPFLPHEEKALKNKA